MSLVGMNTLLSVFFPGAKKGNLYFTLISQRLQTDYISEYQIKIFPGCQISFLSDRQIFTSSDCYKLPTFRFGSPARFSSSLIVKVITFPAGRPLRYVTIRNQVAFFGIRIGVSYFGVKASGSVLSKV